MLKLIVGLGGEITMNTANLQLQGLYIVVASLSGALVRKGILSRDEVDSSLRAAEQSALSFRTKELTPANREAVAFPARLLRMANDGGGEGELHGFSELAKMVGELNNDEPPRAARAEMPDIAFYRSENGDLWELITDVGGKRFVRHTPSDQSGGQIEITELEAFREREPHSIQNQRLEAMLTR